MALHAKHVFVSPEWLHHLAHVIALLVNVPISWYMRKYSHTDPKFANTLAQMNVAGSIFTVCLQIFVQSTPYACPFFFLESIYFLTEWNLFHHRIAIFYQSEVKTYKVLVEIAKWKNYVEVFISLLNLFLYYRMEEVFQADGGIARWCSTTEESNKFSRSISGLLTLCFMLWLLVFGFFTVCRYIIQQRKGGKKQDMKVFWLMLASYLLTISSVIVILMNARLLQGNSSGFALGAVIIDKGLSFMLSVAVYQRIRARKRSSQMPSGKSSNRRQTGTDMSAAGGGKQAAAAAKKSILKTITTVIKTGKVTSNDTAVDTQQ